VKDEALSRMILFGERALHYMLTEYVAHFHQERNHQGKGNVLLFPSSRDSSQSDGPMQCRARLGGRLKYYERTAA
jgi:putative transposase